MTAVNKYIYIYIYIYINEITKIARADNSRCDFQPNDISKWNSLFLALLFFQLATHWLIHSFSFPSLEWRLKLSSKPHRSVVHRQVVVTALCGQQQRLPTDMFETTIVEEAKSLRQEARAVQMKEGVDFQLKTCTCTVTGTGSGLYHYGYRTPWQNNYKDTKL